jgi:hypothetical protein
MPTDTTGQGFDQDLERLVTELAEEVRGRYFGKYRGSVDNIDDPEGIGRIQARVPSVYADRISPWALPAVPFAGAAHGLVLLPEVDDLVWIEFEAGDPARPIWTGTWWGTQGLPDPGGTTQRVLATTGGLKIVLDEDADELRLVHGGGAEIVLSADEIRLEIAGKSLVLSATGLSVNDGALEVT